jgi:hypothetical protein
LAIFSTFTLERIKRRQVFRTATGRAEAGPFQEMRSYLRYGQLPCRFSPEELLPYELLWLGYGRKSPSLGAFKSSPPWWRGGQWPTEAERLPDLARVIENALGQSRCGSGYELADTERFNVVEALDGMSDFLDEVVETLQDLSADLHSRGVADWGHDGHDGHGGDGHGGDGHGGH